MIEHEAHMFPFFAGLHDDDKENVQYTVEDYRGYVGRLSTLGFWGSQEAIWAIAHAKNILVVIHELHDSTKLIKPHTSARGRKPTVYIFFHDNHYKALGRL